MKVDDLVAVTRARLGARRRRVVPPGPLVRAAVLVPIVDRGEAALVFAQRTDRVGHHKGQISFPGGRVDPGDADVLVRKPHTRPMKMRGRAMRGWLRVDAAGVRTRRQLEP